MNATDERLWLTCTHVLNHLANEVWCHTDGIAFCPDCATLGPDGVDDDQIDHCCPQCLFELIKTMPTVRGLETLERDVDAVGHVHESGAWPESRN